MCTEPGLDPGSSRNNDPSRRCAMSLGPCVLVNAFVGSYVNSGHILFLHGGQAQHVVNIIGCIYTLVQLERESPERIVSET